jgi:hypothetical protein
MNGRLFRIISELHGDMYDTPIFDGVKLAEHTPEHGNRLRDLGLMVGGSAAGAGAGYGASKLIRKKFGPTLAKVDPKDRLKYILPALALAGTATTIAKLQQNNYTKNEKTASHYLG